MSTYTPDINNLIAIIENNIPDNTSQAITAQKIRTAMESVAYNYDLYALKADMQEYITQSELSEMSYATQSYVMDRIAEIPGVDLSGYVSKDELSAMGYVTDTQLQQAAYATESYVNDKISEIPAVDLSAYATKTYVSSEMQQLQSETYAYVAEYVSTYAPMPDLSSYVTKSELSGMGYVTGEQLQQAAYVTSSDVYSILDNSSYVTSNELSDAGYINTNALDQRLSDAGYITSSALNGYVTESQLQQAAYATEAYVADYVAAYAPMPDLSSYVTKSELDAMSYATTTYVADYVNTYAPMPDLSSYVTKSELDAMAYSQVVEISSADYDLLSYEQKHNGDIYVLTDSYYEYDMSAYATKAYVVDYVNTYAPAPDLSTYATKAYVADYVAAYAPMPDLSSYVTKTELSNAGYLTATYVHGNTMIVNKLLPAATKTYTLGDNSNLFGRIYATAVGESWNRIEFPNSTNINFRGSLGVALEVYPDYKRLAPADGVTTFTLGDSSHQFAQTYSKKYYLNNTDIETYFATQSYVVDYVNTYAPMPDLSSYVTKTELDNAGYITAAYIDSKGYAKSYTLTQAEYDALIQGGTYDPTTIYIISDAAPVDLSYYATKVELTENIIPKANNTYTLGDSSYFYNATYSSELYVNSNSKIYNDNGGVGVKIGNNSAFRFGTSAFYSVNNNTKTLGNNSSQWIATYTQNLYLDGTDIKSYIDTYYYPKSYVDAYFVSKAELAACGYLTYSNFQYDSVNNTLTIII